MTTTKKVSHATNRSDAQAPQAQEGPQAAQPAAAGAATAASGADAAVADAQAPGEAPSFPNPKRGGLWRVVGEVGTELVHRTHHPEETEKTQGQ